MKTKTTMVIFATGLFLVSCGDKTISQQEKEEKTIPATQFEIDTVVNIADIANKPIKVVNEILGKPGSMDKAKPSITPCKTNPCDKAFYQDSKFEIIFINKVADWITINKVSNIPMTEEAITSLGLPKTKPSFSDPSNVIRWTNIKGIKEISFFNNGSNKVDYIYIKTNTN